MMTRIAASGASTSRALHRSMSQWRFSPAHKFDNRLLRSLPVDAEPKNFVRSVRGACVSRVEPAPIAQPELVVLSPSALHLAGIQVEPAQGHTEEDSLSSLVPFLAGNALFDGSEPAAQCYCGHQFGFFSGQLGDGAAMYLGEVVQEDTRERWELQLKGSGPTPYSRTADGRKVLRSTLREFLCSENMHALGVPTTRAGSVVVSRETQVLRDVFYNGNAAMEPTAVVTRLARSFLRFGSFEIFKATDELTGMAGPSADVENKAEMMEQMLRFTVEQYFPEIAGDDQVVQLFEEVVRRTARLVAKWQTIGFCHGVLNTDNMSVVGDTLDYGPFGFMEHFDPQHVCNTSDDRGRYRYEAQPEVCKWNCGVFADQLGLVVDRSALEPALRQFDDVYQREYLRLMREKLGLTEEHDAGNEDQALIDALFDVLTHTGADFTCTFRYLSELDAFSSGDSREQTARKLVGVSETLAQQKRKLEQASGGFSDAQFEMIKLLLQENPVKARQYGITPALVAQMTAQQQQKEALEATTDEERTVSIRTAWEDWVDLFISRAKEEGDAASDVDRRRRMLGVNPLFVLRNHVAQKAIDLAHEGDYAGVQHIFDLLIHPFDEPSSDDDLQYARPQDPSTAPLCVSCSS